MTSVEAVAIAPRRRLIGQLWFQVVIATVAGILLGHFYPGVAEKTKPLGDAFISLVRMIIGPVIFCSVVHGVAGMNDMKRVGRVALKALGYFLAITLIALVIALVAVNLWKPGAGMNVDASAIDTKVVSTYTAQAGEQTVTQFLLNIIPTTFVGAFAQPNVLQVLLVSLLFAFALTLTFLALVLAAGALVRRGLVADLLSYRRLHHVGRAAGGVRLDRLHRRQVRHEFPPLPGRVDSRVLCGFAAVRVSCVGRRRLVGGC